MILKKNLLKQLEELPEEFSIDELMDRLLFLHKVETGLEQSKKNDVTPHDEVKAEFKEWLD